MTPPPPEPPPERAAPTVGPLALEAALLLDVVADRLESMKSAPDPGSATGEQAPGEQAAGAQAAAGPTGAAGPDGGDQSEAAGSHAGATARCPECGSVPGASCTACPLCRFMALLRGERPEATARLVDGALMIIRTLRSLVPDAPAAGATGTPPTDPPAPPGRRGGLERIDIL